MRRLHKTVRLAFASLLLTSPALVAGQTYVVRRLAPTSKGFSDVHLSKATLPGQQVRIWSATLLNPDCTPEGTITAQIIEAPRHGQASVADGEIFPNFAPPNPRVACNARKVPGKQAFYTSDASFTGHDRFVIQAATSEGLMRDIIVDIDVRQS